MLKSKMQIGRLCALMVTCCTLVSFSARAASYSPIATGGERRVTAWEYTDATHTRVRIAVTHIFTNAEEAATLTFHQPAKVDVLIVGGGGGGSSGAGGGGGGGGIIYKTGVNIAADSYVVTVGTGGVAGVKGGNSSVFGLEAIGGGKGGAINAAGGTRVAPAEVAVEATALRGF